MLRLEDWKEKDILSVRNESMPDYGKATLHLSFLINDASLDLADMEILKAKTMLFFGSLLICAAIQCDKINQ
jgi:hypothetical protein